MSKRFKLRISRVITSFNSSCLSKHPSSLPRDSLPSLFKLSSVNSEITTSNISPTSKPHQYRSSPSSFKRHLSSAFISLGRVFTSKPGLPKALDSSQQFQWQKEENWHVVANIDDDTPRRKIYNSSASSESDGCDVINPPPLPRMVTMEKKKRRVKKKKTTARLRRSTSSADSGWFSSDERTEEEIETLVSISRSFKTDSSSDFNPHLQTIREAPPISRRHKKKLTKHHSKRGVSTKENATPALARLSTFKKLIPCSVEGKVKESFAVMKRSDDPHEDFKNSMMEMILEKHMFEKEDLEQLLQCFLSLNSRYYHSMIVEAFTEIWETLFSVTSVHQAL